MTAARLALVADRSPAVRSHTRVPALLAALRDRHGIDLDAYWIPTEEVAASRLAEFDGVWLLPGSPYRSEPGALRAVRTARTGDLPFLATCGGFQHTLLEYARAVCGLTGVAHAENTPGAEDLLIEPLSCALRGHEGVVRFTAGSLAQRATGVERSVERYQCGYGLNHRHLDTLVAHGLRFTGHDDDGQVRVAELPGHPFFLATLFQPELAGDGDEPHPMVRAFASAVAARAGRRHPAAPVR
ncbi:CTP synthase C-terminal region-related (seleno)protein [Micromonospora sp. IBHARD004]|uniref:CTP synthase C-terminal region-related (seleno)protein n=1 Tax=Micromonospora sp. IBHARD004 TaxID=3457764 RepID=UPI00405830BA